MARGPRKNKVEKLKEALQKVEMELSKINERQKELQDEKKKLTEEIQSEQIKDLTELMEKSNMTVETLTELINSKTGSEDGKEEVAATEE